MHLIVTRPQADAEELQRKLEVRGHRVTIAPLLDIRMGLPRPIPNRMYQAVLITSANGARALADHPARARLLNKMVFAVGPQSRAAALAAGFMNVIEAGGDVTAIVAMVGRDLVAGAGPLLYLSGEETSGDLETVLGRSGYEVERVVMYAAVPAVDLPAPVVGIIKRRLVEGVLLYSRRTAKVWVKCVGAARLENHVDGIPHFCLSAAVASAIPLGWKIRIATTASEQAMLDLIEDEQRTTVEGSTDGG
jgi:uroporphyrinogen-III synthase